LISLAEHEPLRRDVWGDISMFVFSGCLLHCRFLVPDVG
jgi:hypothetical protein